ncbi:MAG: PEP-CTERM sorting domain-containing protein [Akkermansiaceae bacterium]|nr:PEP-CTERM sorting domain-containing protein [Akkermansiaceae bacterium]NNM27919.1 PEP-CTERM sorting domain-containing protein [Akkermansiaceae bacterium]
MRINPSSALGRLLAAWCALAAASSSGFGAIITVPTDLNSGDQYRLVFVTSATRDAASTDISEYNQFVETIADATPDLQALGTDWYAIGATDTVDARDNTATNPTIEVGVPIYSVNGVRLADDYADLWDGFLAAAYTTDENGNEVSGLAWTGMHSNGVARTGGALGEAVGRIHVGELGNEAQSGGWSGDGASRPDNTEQNHLYGMSALLTVAPEPSGALLSLVAIAAIGLRRRRS